MAARFFLGLDLGQQSDYTAVSVLEETPAAPDEGRKEKAYAVRHLERFRRVPYPDVVDRVEHLLNGPALRHRTELIIDTTGVGAPVADLFRKRNRQFRGVLITGGDVESRGEDRSYRVPKRNLVSQLQILLQSGRLKIAGGLELSEVLKSELTNFKVKINLNTAHDSYEAWRENDHDDLVLSVALAAWGASKIPVPQAPVAVPIVIPSLFGGALPPPSPDTYVPLW